MAGPDCKTCRRVGVSWNRMLTRNLNFEDGEVLQVYRAVGLELVKVDLLRPLKDQGHLDALLQKVVDVFPSSREDRLRAVENVQNYLAQHPNCLLLNRTANTELLNDRTKLFPFMKKALENEDDVYVPAFVELTTTNEREMSQKLSGENIAFPIVCKPVTGTNHQMTVVFSEAGLGDVPSPCVAQAFVQHCGTLYKTYMMGDSQWQFIRNSLADLQPGGHPSVTFHSPSIGKLDRGHILRGTEELRPLPNEDALRLREVSKRLRRVVGMDLIGIDFIYDVATGKYAVIDINDFPAYTGVKDFHQYLSRYILDQLNFGK